MEYCKVGLLPGDGVCSQSWDCCAAQAIARGRRGV